MIDPADVGPQRRPVITCDLAVAWGGHAIKGNPTEAVAGLYWAENGDAEAVCADYGLTRHELAVALWYEATHGEARTEFPGWAHWAKEVANPRLAGWVKPLEIETLPMPPARGETDEKRSI